MAYLKKLMIVSITSLWQLVLMISRHESFQTARVYKWDRTLWPTCRNVAMSSLMECHAIDQSVACLSIGKHVYICCSEDLYAYSTVLEAYEPRLAFDDKGHTTIYTEQENRRKLQLVG